MAGTGVNVYHVDTGIRFTHTEFGFIDGSPGSRAKPGFSVFGDDNTTDCFGHGTHTAATIGGKQNNLQRAVGNVCLLEGSLMHFMPSGKAAAVQAVIDG